MRYSLRRAVSLDSVDGGTYNPTVNARCWLSPTSPFLDSFRVGGQRHGVIGSNEAPYGQNGLTLRS